MVKKLNSSAAIALANKYGFNLQMILSLGIKTHSTAETGKHALMVCRYPTTYAAAIYNRDGDTVERFNFN
jgi:hypothetical protein